jgi:hypothetical protein
MFRMTGRVPSKYRESGTSRPVSSVKTSAGSTVAPSVWVMSAVSTWLITGSSSPI